MKIILKGKPVPQRRPEVRIWGGRAMGYDPSRPKKDEMSQQLIGQHIELLSGDQPLKVCVNAYMPIPKSLSQKKQKELDGQYHIKRPDWDNIYKFYTDLLEGVAYEKDECICDTNGKKIYSFDPRVEIIIKKITS